MLSWPPQRFPKVSSLHCCALSQESLGSALRVALGSVYAPLHFMLYLSTGIHTAGGGPPWLPFPDQFLYEPLGGLPTPPHALGCVSVLTSDILKGLG